MLSAQGYITGKKRVLSQDDIEHEKEVLQIGKENIARKACQQCSTDTGQSTTTKPRLDDSGNTVTPVVSSHNPQGHKYVQLFCRLPPFYKDWTYPVSARN